MSIKNKHTIKATVQALLLLLLMAACATPGGVPLGGDKDVTPPKVLAQTPPPLTKNYHGSKIILSFDEYIELQSPQQEIIITPAPEGTPLYNIRKKNLEIDLKNVKLDSNTTYTISFGKAVKDYNEGNILSDFQYVFSTGQYLDSLKLSGSVTDALSGKTVEKALVVLQKPGYDSAAYKKRPMYYTYTDASGNFTQKNLPRTDFRLYVLQDKNSNYLLDADEGIGFVNETIRLDSNMQIARPIKISVQKPPQLLISNVKAWQDAVQLKFNQHPDTVILSYATAVPGKVYTRYFKTDSVQLWPAKVPVAGQLKITARAGQLTADTIVTVTDGLLNKEKLPVTYLVPAESYNKYGTPLTIEAKAPIVRINTKLCTLSQGNKTLTFSAIRFMDSTHTRLGFFYDFEADSTYHVQLLPGALTAYSDAVNDTFSSPITMPDKRNFAYLEMNVQLPASSNPYLFQLVKESGDVVYEKVLRSSGKQLIPFVNVGNYRVRVIHDLNNNGQYDPGNLLSGQQPEPVYYMESTLNLKANWEMLDLQFKVPGE